MYLVRLATPMSYRVYCLALVMRSEPCLLDIKRVNDGLRNSSGQYNFVSVASKMSSERNLMDGVHLSRHGVSHLIYILRKRVLGTVLRFSDL